MYIEFFGLSESPFNITPSSRFYYRTPACEEILSVVRHGIETRKGVIVVTGEPGTGKTLLLKSLVREISPKVRTVVVYHPPTDLNGSLRILFNRLELGTAGDDTAVMFDRLTDYLIAQRKNGGTICLLIDEAQDLNETTLDELRFLSNLECDDEALLPIVLMGQPELRAKLDHPSARRIKQRIVLSRHTYPLVRMNIGPYIHSRLEVANYQGAGIFGAEAIARIAAYSEGFPRLVNTICDNCLIRAYTANQTAISAEIVDQVARELRIAAPLREQGPMAQAGCGERRNEPTPLTQEDDCARPDPLSPKEAQKIETEEVERPAVTALNPQSCDSLSGQQFSAPANRPGYLDADTNPCPDIQLPPKIQPKPQAGPIGLLDRTALPSLGTAYRSLRQRWRAGVNLAHVPLLPDVRRCAVQGMGLALNPLRSYCYAVVAVVGLLMLALGINVIFSQWEGIYSAVSAGKQTTAMEARSHPPQQGQVEANVETTGAAAMPEELLGLATAEMELADSRPRLEISVEPARQPSDARGNKLKLRNGTRSQPVPGVDLRPDARNTAQEAIGKKPIPLDALQPPAARSGMPRREDAPTAPKVNGKKGADPTRTVKVISASLVRNRPNAQAEIISTLEPGSRVTVLAASGDYFYVRSMEQQSIRGYVHREDAFFERKK